ncbi:FAD-dependent monooxygenase [Streptomyces noursei]|uniref:FAD-dependent monooxygenase n=1 Tax=Streptomyces noursei TaxID=1971 RepID=UPI0030F13F4F
MVETAETNTNTNTNTNATVVIVGAGVAGFTLGNFLLHSGIVCVVVEKHSRADVEKRQRAGAVDSRGVRLFREWGLADVVKDGSSPKEITGGTWLDGGMYPLGFEDVDTDAVFRPQQVLVRNLTDAFLEAGGDLRFEALDVSLAGIDSECPTVHYRNPDGTTTTVTCDFVAGCDGFHGVSRASVPAGQLTLARPATLPSSGRTSASGAN